MSQMKTSRQMAEISEDANECVGIILDAGILTRRMMEDHPEALKADLKAKAVEAAEDMHRQAETLSGQSQLISEVLLEIHRQGKYILSNLDLASRSFPAGSTEHVMLCDLMSNIKSRIMLSPKWAEEYERREKVRGEEPLSEAGRLLYSNFTGSSPDGKEPISSPLNQIAKDRMFRYQKVQEKMDSMGAPAMARNRMRFTDKEGMD